MYFKYFTNATVISVKDFLAYNGVNSGYIDSSNLS
ncbi:Uncharacterised protein [Escherichia coli]|uniref:Uncharacterized protein n=1 Tax=Escherichia coli TaxID=562 RepID=A0A376LB06_ECOLX|nr:Uncharacterised protein [Escherichia coli]